MPQPGPGQESVSPRPPRLEDTTKHIQVIFNGVAIADTDNAMLETSHPPVYYIPQRYQNGILMPHSSW